MNNIALKKENYLPIISHAVSALKLRSNDETLLNGRSWTDSPIHMQTHVQSKKAEKIPIGQALAIIGMNLKDDDTSHIVNKYRNALWDCEIAGLDEKKGFEEIKDDLKKNIPSVCFSGKFKGSRAKDNFIPESCTNTFVIDIDKLDITIPNAVSDMKDKLARQPFTRFVFVSPSENGLKVGLHVPTFRNDADIKIIFEHVDRYFEDKLDITIDKSCKDASRLCFLSIDKDIRINEYASMMDIDMKPKPVNNPEKEINQVQSFDNEFEVLPQAQEAQGWNISAKSNVVPFNNSKVKDSYVKNGLDKELQTLINTSKGGRNNQLNKSALSMFGIAYINRHEAMYPEIREQLLSAALQIGLKQEEALITINSAFKSKEKTTRKPYEAIAKTKLVANGGNQSYVANIEDSAKYGTNQNNTGDKIIDDILSNNKETDIGNPVIVIKRGYDSVILDACQGVLNDTNRFFYNRTGICEIKKDTDNNTVTLLDCTPEYVCHALGSIIDWKMHDKKGVLNHADSPATHLKKLSKLGEYKYLRNIESIVRQPIIDLKGNLITETGYNKQHKSLLEFDIDKFDIKDNPTKQDAMEAMGELKVLLSECKFKDDYDLSASLNAILTGITRSYLPTAPMILVNAYTAGTGKSYLCDMIMAFNTPNIISATSFPETSEEFTKTIIPLLSESNGCINFDNLNVGLRDYKDLCSYVTNGNLKSRVLGSSKMQASNSRELLISSGNNIGAVKDMKRRTQIISLDAGFENSVTRKFKSNPIYEIRDNREKYLSLGYTIIIAYLKSGDKVKAKPIASFGEWNKMCREPIIWLGEEDPATRMLDNVSNSSDDEVLGDLLSAWHEVYGTRPKTVKLAIPFNGTLTSGTSDSNPNKALFIAMLSASKEMLSNNSLKDLDSRAIGKYLSQNEGVPASGLMIKKKSKSDKSKKAVQWYIEVDPKLEINTENNTDTEAVIAENDIYDF